MTKVVKVQEATAHLSALLKLVESGEEVLICRGSVPLARLVPMSASGRRELGFVPYQVPGSFLWDLPRGELDAWEA